MSATWNFAEFYKRKAAWSLETFGPAQTTAGVVAHMRKEAGELVEAIVDSGDSDAIREELADVCLLALDMSWRAGGDASDFGEIVGERDHMPARRAADYIDLHLGTIERGAMPPRAGAVVIWDIAFRALSCNPSPILEKFEALQLRTWPDWRTVPADQPIEHVREVDPTEEWMKREFERSANSTPAVLIEEKPMSISRDAYGARLIAKCDRLKEEIAKLTTERDDERALREINQQEIRGLSAQLANASDERDRLRANDEASVRERNHVLKLLDADPGETLIQTVRRHVERATNARAVLRDEEIAPLKAELATLREACEADEQERSTLVAERDCQSKRGDDFLDMLRNIRTALGIGEGWTAALVIERAGQLRDDSVAYRSLRGRLLGLLDMSSNFDDEAVIDTITDHVENPVNDAALDAEEVVTDLEEDIATLKAALHVATRGRP